MKRFRVTVVWSMIATVEIEAEDAEGAAKVAEADGYPLPTNGEYLEASFDVDRDTITEVKP